MKRFAKRLRIVFVLMLALFAVGVAGAGLYLVTQDDDDWWRILTYWVERETGKRLTITGDFKARRQQWPGFFKQLQMWSSVIDYTRVPRCDRQATQALIDSIEHAALRLDAAEHVHQQSAEALDEPLRKLLGRFYDSCAESFHLIASSLADLKPIPNLPDTRSLVCEIESRGDDLRRSATGDNDIFTSVQGVMRITAHMNLLADELNNCRDKVNALDWEGWNRNYF